MVPFRVAAARAAPLVLACALLAGCAGGGAVERESVEPFPPAPATPRGPLAAPLRAHVEAAVAAYEERRFDRAAIRGIGASRDPRAAWVLSDLLRAEFDNRRSLELLRSFERLTGARLTGEERYADRRWRVATDHLIAWELPAPPGYAALKRRLLLRIEPRWAPLLADPEARIDWRILSWGGVLIDDRPLGAEDYCVRGCIAALDDPAVTGAEEGAWYRDDALVFGVVVGGEARAYPKHMMEVHELVNDTLGGRFVAVPYCTLCGSAQAYYADTVGDERLVLRTSGLLSRSNKVMYELRTKSVFDTFTGRAVAGPLRRAGVRLEEITVVTSTWAAWRKAHPDTTILAEDGGVGRSYPDDPLGGRDLGGPIFPIGDVDPRLPVQEQVVGVVAPDGTPVAFPAAAARAALDEGRTPEAEGVRLVLDGDGLRARLAGGEEVVSHQAFWFAWSQFHPGSVVWAP